MDRLKIRAMWFQNFGYSVVRKNSSTAPHSAVALYANTTSLLNSFDSLSYFTSFPTIPISAQITANIGTPSTNAANMRWTSAAIHTAPRGPMPGKWPYAGLVSVAAFATCNSAITGAISLLVEEEGAPLREVDRHRPPHLLHQLRGDLRHAAVAREVLEPLRHHAAHERRDTIQPRFRVGAPRQGARGAHAVRHRAPSGHERRVLVRHVAARRVLGQHVVVHRERAGAAAAAHRAVLAPPAPAA